MGRLPDWAGFGRIWWITGATLFVVILSALVIVDPYDTGRLTFLDRPGVSPQGPRTANASRGRDPNFDAAIIGNSHVQLLDPARLSAATGGRFVSLIVPATHSSEQLVMLDWFLRHHEKPSAVVLGIDENWCRTNSTYREQPFPDWLYAKTDLEYLAGLITINAIERLPGRLAAMTNPESRARPDGYWDYEPDYLSIGYGDMAHVRSKLAGQRPTYAGDTNPPIPAAGLLKQELTRLPASSSVVMVFPPRYINHIPVQGSDADKAEQVCHDAFRRIAAERPNTHIIDWSRDRPENRAETNFFDMTHYRGVIARMVEADIAAAIGRR